MEGIYIQIDAHTKGTYIWRGHTHKGDIHMKRTYT